MTPEEQKLVDTFRNCSDIGKNLIPDHAESIRKTLPADQDPDDRSAGVSTSAIG